MTIQMSSVGNTLTISLSGRLDTVTAPALERLILDMSDAVRNVCFDFSNLTYISSAGLRTLLICQKRMTDGRSMKVVGVTGEIEAILDATGFSSILAVERAHEKSGAMSFRSFLRDRAATRGNATAFSFGDERYTWSDIARNANAIAAELARRGVRKRSHVAICGLNSPNWVFAFFAVQQLGAIAVLLNYGLTPAELAALARIGDITHLCYGEMPGARVDPTYMAKLAREEGASCIEHLDITRDVDFASARTAADVSPETVEADDPAVMIFTSGSTALPKAVLLSAFQIFCSSRNIIARLELTQRDRMCLVLPLFHIFGFMGVLVSSLLMNAGLAMPSSLQPDEILRTLSGERCTAILSVPTLMLTLAEHPGLSQYDVSSLRAISLAGAAVQPTQLRLLMERFPSSRISIGYGLSEMAPAITTTWNDTDEHVFHTIGKPCNDVLVRVRELSTERDCAIGEIGEILLKSPNQMVCYYKLSVDRQPIDGDGWLHTGDLGSVLEDGAIRLSGRLKELIIRGGENIAPSEVAAAIATHASVADVRVFGVPSAHWGEEVAAAVILRPGASLSEAELHAYLMPRLSGFKLPAYLLCLERFPLLANGKVDMLSLRKTAEARLGIIAKEE